MRIFLCQIGEGAEQKGGRRWFDPTQKPFWERVKAETDALLDWVNT
jgi:hypothetical protein